SRWGVEGCGDESNDYEPNQTQDKSRSSSLQPQSSHQLQGRGMRFKTILSNIRDNCDQQKPSKGVLHFFQFMRNFVRFLHLTPHEFITKESAAVILRRKDEKESNAHHRNNSDTSVNSSSILPPCHIESAIGY